jgi:hypothetical protein
MYVLFYRYNVCLVWLIKYEVESSWNVMAHGDAREGKWRGNWRMEWVASTLHTTSEHGVSSITTADAHTSAASRRLNWRPRRFKWTRPFRRKTKFGVCACAITFQTQSDTNVPLLDICVVSYCICKFGCRITRLLWLPTFLYILLKFCMHKHEEKF